MWMTDYIQEIQRQLIKVYGFGEDPDRPGVPLNVPDGVYPMAIEGKLDWVRIVDGYINCCNFYEGPNAVQEFATMDVLSLLTGVMLSNDKGRGMKALMSFLVGSPVDEWWGLPHAQKRVSELTRAVVLEQLPELIPYETLPNGADTDTWVESVIQVIGPTLTIQSIASPAVSV